MTIQFQTRKDEGSIRMNSALKRINLTYDTSGKLLDLTLYFDGTTYDRTELEDTVNRHLGRGTQNMIVPLAEQMVSLVVEPQSSPLFGEDEIVTSYKILATGKH